MLVLTAFCLLPSAFFLQAASGRYEVREVKPHIFVWVPEDILDQDGDPQFNRAGTAGFIITQDGVVVVDTTNTPMHARELLFEIRRRTELPVKYVINTGPGGDRVLGNEVFLDQQASIISTAATRADMNRYQRKLSALMDDLRLKPRLRGLHFTLASRVFEKEMDLLKGEEEIKLLDLGTGDAVVYLPRAKVLFLGDLFENKYIPRVDSRGIREWIEVLRKVETWDVDAYVPGHGPLGTKREVSEFREFLEWLSKEVQARVRQEKSLTQVKSELIPFANYPWHAVELAPQAVEAVYQQLTGAGHSTRLAEGGASAKSTDH